MEGSFSHRESIRMPEVRGPGAWLSPSLSLPLTMTCPAPQGLGGECLQDFLAVMRRLWAQLGEAVGQVSDEGPRRGQVAGGASPHPV